MTRHDPARRRPTETRRVHRLEPQPAALAGVMMRDIVLFRRYWKATTFSSIVQPTIYLLAFGLGFRVPAHARRRRQVRPVRGHRRRRHRRALLLSAFPGMFNTFI